MILTFLLNITEISFFDVVCWFASEDLGVIVLPFEDIDCVILFKLDVDERPINKKRIGNVYVKAQIPPPRWKLAPPIALVIKVDKYSLPEFEPGDME